jgi:hypothetical protein
MSDTIHVIRLTDRERAYLSGLVSDATRNGDLGADERDALTRVLSELGPPPRKLGCVVIRPDDDDQPEPDLTDPDNPEATDEELDWAVHAARARIAVQSGQQPPDCAVCDNGRKHPGHEHVSLMFESHSVQVYCATCGRCLQA